MFISVAGNTDPVFPSSTLATITDTGTKSDGTEYDQRYQEMVPGLIMYGSEGEQPHPIQAQRPGVTFQPFVRVIGQSIAMSLGIPYPVLFKDFTGMNFASYRSAMLEAWRVYKQQRTWLAAGLCQPVYRMLQEEAWLLGHLKVAKFYNQMYHITRADWIGPPKGQIEPVKEVQADILAIQNNLKSRTETALEANRDHKKTVKQLAEEQRDLKAAGLDEAKFEMVEETQSEGDNESN
jgi:capsid protein